jgi:thioesterase domain-containing protein
MHPEALTAYLHARIPLSWAMEATVTQSDAAGVVVIAAPLAPNVNHRDTVFGGSASALGLLAAWSALFVRMQAERIQGRIVVRRNTMSYERPIASAFSARAVPPQGDDWEKLKAALARGRMTRARVVATLECDTEIVGRLEAEFAVMPPDAPTIDRP